MTSFCTLLPDLSFRSQPIRCQHLSCVVTVVMATLALLHLPILIHSPSPNAPPPLVPSFLSLSLTLSRSSLPSVFIKLIPIWPAVSESSCWGADAVNSTVIVFVNTAPSVKHTKCCNINTIVLVCRLVWELQEKIYPPSVFQELCNKKANGVPVGSAGEGRCHSGLLPAQLRAEPLEEVQLLRWEPGSQHPPCTNVRLLREKQACDSQMFSWRHAPYFQVCSRGWSRFTWGWSVRNGKALRAQATCSSFSARVTVQVL